MIVRATLFDRFFDRTAELGALTAAFREAARSQRAATIVVTGDAGIGKSRLLAEFRKNIASERGYVVSGACLEYARTPYGPFLDALANERAAAKAVEALRETSDRITSHGDDKLRRFKIVEQSIRRTIAMRATTVLILEDVHWSDAASLELFHYLGRELADVAALLIATARSDEIEAVPELDKAVARLIRDGAAELRLEGIPDGVVADAIRTALPDGVALARNAVQRICDLAEGRPLIAEELLRGTLDHAQAGDVNPRTVVSIRSTIVERLQRFTPAAQLALTYAAVIGRDFDSKLLARITDLSEAEVLRIIREARNAQLIKQTADNRFSFRHAITREVLYRELLTGEARALHATIAAVLEDGVGENRADEVAYHWWAARDPVRGMEWNERVGDQAAAMNAYADAAVRYERALSFADRGSGRRAALLEKATSALVTIGDMERARTLCREAAEERRARGDDDTALRLMIWVARQWYEAGSAAEALATVRTVRDQLAERAPTAIHYTAETTYAAILALQGQPAEALELLKLAADWKCAHDPIDDFRALNTRGIASGALGNYAAAIEAYSAAGDLAERLGNVDLLLHARNNTANTLALTGAMHRALDIYTEAAALAGRHGHRRVKALLCVNVVYCRVSLGDLAGARAVLRDELDERSAATAVKIWAHALRVRLRTLTGDDVEPAEPFTATLDAALKVGDPQVVALAGGAIAKHQLAAGDLPSACATIDGALYAVPSFDYMHWLLDAVAQAGDERAIAYGRGLLEEAQRHGNPLADASRSLFEARTAARRGGPDESAEPAQRAHEAFSALGFPIEAAEALEAAGDLAGALAIYQLTGASAAAGQLEGRIGRRRSAAAGGAQLTPREHEIAELLARGYSSRVVATELGIGQRTVETHVAAIYHKLGIKSRAELARRIGMGPAPRT